MSIDSVARRQQFLLNGDMTYAASIRALRSGRNWTQADLAKRIGRGITNQSVSGWERGIAKPSRDNVVELSRIFGVPLEQFLTEGGAKQHLSQSVQETANQACWPASSSTPVPNP